MQETNQNHLPTNQKYTPKIHIAIHWFDDHTAWAIMNRGNYLQWTVRWAVSTPTAWIMAAVQALMAPTSAVAAEA